MTIRVGIALYLVRAGAYSNSPSYWHWCLVASQGESWAAQPVTTLELVKDSNGRYVQSVNDYDITHSNAFRGVVHIFTTSNYTVNSFRAMIRDRFPASDSGWRYPGLYGPQGWTCATWILQVLYNLRAEGTWICFRSFEETYTRVLNLGSDLLERSDTVSQEGAVRVIHF
ncbi:hypothetical protein FB446DRAFT_178025 [Lentinula raphanica]|nr:hypothetical protein C8R42DRAFT_464942 [Lentinula raphanica]KAJ3770163.1 hypothetical protein FB446DRAFT_178025 [Lentinula raphanica]